MSEETTVETFVGNVQGDVILRFTNTGKAVANFDIRIGQGRGKKPVYKKVTCWEQLGENVAESLTNGDRIVVRGKVETRNWVGKDGTPKSGEEITAWNVAADLNYATVSVNRIERAESEAPEAAAAPALAEF